MASSSSNRLILNREALLERVGYDEEILREIATIFLESVPDQLEQVRDAVAARNPNALNQSAHSLKGAVGNFTLDGPYQAALALERMGKSGALETAPEKIAVLETELERLRIALRELK